MIWTNGAGASTGMFVPALAVGATGGRMAGRIVKMIVRCGIFVRAFWIPAVRLCLQHLSAVSSVSCQSLWTLLYITLSCERSGQQCGDHWHCNC